MIQNAKKATSSAEVEGENSNLVDDTFYYW